MATEMKKYVVGVVVEKLPEKEINLEHYKCNGRSEYEAIAYVLRHRMEFKGNIIHAVNAIVCDGESRFGDNSETLLNAD